jgi:hypothetical protein
MGGGACTASQVVAGPLTISGGDLVLNLTNNSGVLVTIDAMHIVWNVTDATKLLSIKLGGTLIGNPSTTTSPSIFPAPLPFGGPAGGQEIAIATAEDLVISFSVPTIPVTSVGYTVQVHFFEIGCQVSASIPP